MRDADLKNFLQSSEQSCSLYLALSVGQYYHEGAHAASQVACLENIRESVESWIQTRVSEFSSSSEDVVNRRWRVNVIDTASHQAVNDYPDVELELDATQCVRFVDNPELKELEQEHLVNGQRLEIMYRKLFACYEDLHEDNVEINFEFAPASIKWAHLKQFYKEPQFINMVNYLEACLKFGLKKILTAIQEQSKLPACIMKKVKQGLFDNWQEILKLNDVSYVIVETVMLYWKIFQRISIDEQLEPKFLIYPGPLDVMLGVGRNLLAVQFKEIVQNAPFTFLRMQNLAKLSENTEKEALLFTGLLDESCEMIEVPEKLVKQRVACIESVVDGKVNRSRMILHAIKENMEQRDAKESERKRKKTEAFLKGDYVKFLRGFQLHSQKYSDVIREKVLCCSYQWDARDPIGSIIQLCRLITPREKPSEESPKLVRLNSYVSGVFCKKMLNVLISDFLVPLRAKYFNTTSTGMKAGYLTQIACGLVQSAADARVELGCCEAPTQKKLKVVTIGAMLNTCNTFFSKKLDQESVFTAKEPEFFQKFQAVMIFGILQLGKAGVKWESLFEQKYYPSHTAEVDFRNSQEPSQSSFPDNV